MKFIDEAIITVQSGNGGRGCVSFRREKFIPRGGPDGGDGGNGGDVILTASSQKRTLYPFRHQHFFRAKNGGHGQGRQKTGKSAQSLIIEIPPGTIVSNPDTGEIYHDFLESGETVVIARGGRGGQGNKRFTTSTNRAPRFAQPGEPAQIVTLKLELKLLADVGIIGFPNAGKSTLISVLSSARPKIGDYPFTTLAPNLGMVKPERGEPYVVADMPGIIEDAHTGAGLGLQFLKHIERTKILVHLIDAAAIDPENPLDLYKKINRELELHSKKLAEKPQIIVLNKLDLPDAEKPAKAFQSEIQDKRVILISAATGKNIKNLKQEIAGLLERINET
ncbi:MAG: GTPase ObgE [Desulfobacterales bacterium]